MLFIIMTESSCHLLIDGCPTQCCACQISLCLRQQVVNLALGFTDVMHCLNCLAQKNQKEPEFILDDLQIYIQSRECFKSQWVKYLDETFCPSPKECYPSVCFKEPFEE